MTTKKHENVRSTPHKGESLSKKVEQLTNENQTLLRDKQEVAKKLAELTKTIAELSKEKEEETKKFSTLKKLNKATEKECEDLEDKLFVCTVDPELIGALKSLVGKRIKNLEKKQESLKQENEKLRADIQKNSSDSIKERKELQTTIETLQKTFDKQKKDFEDKEVFNQREREKFDLEMKKQQQNFATEKEKLLKEKGDFHLLIEKKDKEIAEQKQLLINERARNDSSIGSDYLSNGEIKISQVQKLFDEAVNCLSELLVATSSYCGSDTDSFQKHKKSFHQKVIASLFGEGLWKLVKKKDRRTEKKISTILTGKEGDELDRKTLETSLVSTIEGTIDRLVEEEFQSMVQRSDEIQTCIKTCAQHALLLATHMTLCEPKMGVIVPKFGKKETFNPEKHEDASITHQMIVSFTKRPGLICTIDNRVVTRASVETVLKNLE